MPLKGRDTPADRPRNELEEEYSRDQVGGVRVYRPPRRRQEMETISGAISDMLSPLQLDHY